MSRSINPILGRLAEKRCRSFPPRSRVKQVGINIGSQHAQCIVGSPHTTCRVNHMNILAFRTLQRLRALIDKYLMGRIPAGFINIMPFPFKFRFRDEHTFRPQCPGILQPGNVNTLCFRIYPARLPARPDHIQFSFVLKHRAVNSPIVVFVRTDTPFHHKLTFKRVLVCIFKHIHLMIVRIAVIGSIVDVPFALNVMNLRCP